MVNINIMANPQNKTALQATRLVMVDLDDTLIMRNPCTKQSEMSQANFLALKKLNALDHVQFGIATGRDLRRINNLLATLTFLKDPVPVVALNGGCVYFYNPQDQSVKILAEKFFEPAQVRQILQWADELRLEICGFNYENMRCLLSNDPDGLMSKVLFEMLHCKTIQLFDHHQLSRVWKFKIAGNEQQQARFFKKIAVFRTVNYPFFKQSHFYGADGIWYEVNPLGTSKALGVMTILDVYALTPDQLIAIGDGYNDHELLSMAKWGFLVCDYEPKTLSGNFEYFVTKNPREAVALILKEHFKL